MAHARQSFQTIHIHPQAPAKPAAGQPCNGCGWCCLAEPCPLGVLLSGRRRGACNALQWSAAQGLYRCAAVQAPRQALQEARWPVLRGLARPLAGLLGALAGRWIAAGQGCDSTVEAVPMASSPHD